MANFIFHIGLPKTGTKYLQSHFREFSPQLQDKGILYPADWWTSKSDVSHGPLLDLLAEPEPGAVEATFKRFRESPFDRVLISCEGLVSMSRAQLERLRRLTAGSKVTVVFLCRRWSDWLPSAWQQSVKSGSTSTFPEFLADILSYPRRHPAIDFQPALEAFATAFGEDSLTIISYTNAVEAGVDLFRLFCRDILGFTEDLAPAETTVHRSVGLVTAELIRCLNVAEIASSGSADVSVCKRFERFRRHASISPSIDELLAIMQDYAREVPLDDTIALFSEIYARLSERFRAAILPVAGRASLFEPRRTAIRAVRQDFLLMPDVAGRIAQIHAALVDLAGDAGGIAPRDRQLTVLHGEAAASYFDAVSAAPSGSQAERPAAVLDFAGEGSTGDLALEGWSKAEASFRWTDGSRAVIQFARPDRPGDYKLACAVKPFTVKDKIIVQRARVSLNGHFLGTASIAAAGVLECSLPWRLLADHPSVLIELALPDAARPSDVTLSRDTRQLGLRFERAVLFEPVAVAA
jgi:hypothetical protein